MGSSRRDALGAWILASRPKTLVASVVPVAVGSALAYRDTGEFPTALFALALLFSVLIQIGTNFSNDYFDNLRGADSKRALGPQRAVSSGLISGKTMLVVSLITLILAFASGVVLMETAGANRKLLWIGITSVLFAIGYTGGPFPLAYNGLGDLFVILFFGFVAVCATHYVLVVGVGGGWQPNWIVPLGVGFSINNLLVVNNTRDCEEDRLVGKKTSVVLLGRRSGLILYATGVSVSTLVCPYLDNGVVSVIWVFPLGLFCLLKLAKASTREDYGWILLATAITILAYGGVTIWGLLVS
jgi:1,4-dihydroxy-2-naphthoate polyprenyltransferase